MNIHKNAKLYKNMRKSEKKSKGRNKIKYKNKSNYNLFGVRWHTPSVTHQSVGNLDDFVVKHFWWNTSQLEFSDVCKPCQNDVILHFFFFALVIKSLLKYYSKISPNCSIQNNLYVENPFRENLVVYPLPPLMNIPPRPSPPPPPKGVVDTLLRGQS